MLSEYETFVAQNWVEPVGSLAAHAHFYAKASEEAQEVLDEVRLGYGDADRARLVAELGDSLFCLCALGINAGIPPSEALESAVMTADSATITHVTTIDRRARDRDDYLELPESSRRLGLAGPELLRAVRAGHRTLLRPVLAELTSRVTDNTLRAYMVNSAVEYEGVKPDAGVKALQAIWRHDARIDIAGAVLLHSLLAQVHCGVGIGEVLTVNRRKIHDRLEAGEPVTRF